MADSGIDSARGVAEAFLSNCSGGADCFAVDLQLIAEEVLTERLSDAFASVRHEMVSADAASWRIKNAAEATAVIVAAATTGSGADSSTTSQEFTLHVDLLNAHPIAGVDVSERFKFP